MKNIWYIVFLSSFYFSYVTSKTVVLPSAERMKDSLEELGFCLQEKQAIIDYFNGKKIETLALGWLLQKTVPLIKEVDSRTAQLLMALLLHKVLLPDNVEDARSIMYVHYGHDAMKVFDIVSGKKICAEHKKDNTQP